MKSEEKPVVKDREYFRKLKNKSRHKPKPKNQHEAKHRKTRRYSCQSCTLSFFQEELEIGRYSFKHKKCMRCLLVESGREGKINLPPCFGSYDGGNVLCNQKCGARQGCIIEYVDKTSQGWTTEWSKRLKNSVKDILFRVLVSMGRPMHIIELAVALEKSTNSLWSRVSEDFHWKENIVRHMKGPEIVKLGDGFYVWTQVWDFFETGSEMAKPSGLKKPKLITPEEIFAEQSGKNK